MEFKIKTLENLRQLSVYIKDNYWHEKIFLLRGNLGAGKTQLIKFLLEDLTLDPVTSPTFNLLNVYKDKKNNTQYFHFDLYKKNNIPIWQLEEIGFHELFENIHNKCFIEWPENLSFSLGGVEIIFTYNEEDRIVNIKTKGNIHE
jgi:tRNA threonylcarbamoyladenosine biosynthesis protein TsaE